MRDNNFASGDVVGATGMCSNIYTSFYNYIRYIQTFERILSYGPVIASSVASSNLFPHYYAKQPSRQFGGHAYLAYGITKYMVGDRVEALLVCVDPNLPEYDTFIPLSIFASQKWAFIYSADRAQIRPNTDAVEYQESDLRIFSNVITQGILDKSKVHPFYRYMEGYGDGSSNARVVTKLADRPHYSRPHNATIH